MKEVVKKIVTISCRVVSGIGEGGKYVRLGHYEDIFKKLLNGEKPYPGTLNIHCDINYKELINICKPEVIPNIEGYGGFYYWYAILENPKLGSNSVRLNVIVLRPFLSRHKEYVLEIVSNIYLRGYLMLRDGDAIKLSLICNEECGMQQ